MSPTTMHVRTLIRHFERQDGVRTAQVLFAMARNGMRNPMKCLHGHPFEDDWMDFAGACVREHVAKRQGIVYVVANPVHAGLYKIGLTAGNLEKRLRSLKTAGVVGEFIEIDQAKALDRHTCERMAHKAMATVAQRHKEFFVTDWKTACAAVQTSVAKDNAILKASFGNWFF